MSDMYYFELVIQDRSVELTATRTRTTIFSGHAYRDGDELKIVGAPNVMTDNIEGPTANIGVRGDRLVIEVTPPARSAPIRGRVW